MWNAKRILVPIDFSKESRQALEWAVKLVQGEKEACIGLCHVIPVMAAVGPDAMTFDYYRIEKKSALNRLGHWRRTIPRGIRTFVAVAHGGVAEEVARLCGEKLVDLVITTTHGRQGFSHFVHGSASEELVRIAPCPVLVLHLGQALPVAA